MNVKRKPPFNEKEKEFYVQRLKTKIKITNNFPVLVSEIKKEELKQNDNPSAESIQLLANPDLFEIIVKEFDKKAIGEVEAKKTIFLVSSMRLVENLNKATDNLIINAYTGTGKDHLTEAIFGIIPEEEKEELIRISPKVLSYTRNKATDPNATWKKIALRLEDVENNVLNDDAFKVMLSANPNKLNKSKIVFKGKVLPFFIEGKPSIIMTIAEANPKSENLRRSPFCYLDEGIDQTKEILKRQSEYAQKGISIEYDENLVEAIKCLKRVKVKVPFADTLVKIFNPQEVIVRTHFPRFLDYIKASCAIHQFQRDTDESEYYLAQKEDYEIARTALIKTTSNILMIPLTKLQKNILDCFEKYDLHNKSVDDLEEYKEIEKLNITPEWLRRQLDFLASKTFLIKGKEKRFDEAGKVIPKPVFVFNYNKLQKLDIPNWEELSKMTSITSNKDFTSNSSITSDTRVNEVNEVNDVNFSISNNDKKRKSSGLCNNVFSNKSLGVTENE